MTRRTLVVAFAVFISVAGATQVQPRMDAEAKPSDCPLDTEGVLTVEQLPPGASVVKCQAVGRLVRRGRLVVAVPPPGQGAGAAADYAEGAETFAVEVSADGEVSYPDSAETSAPSDGPGGPDACIDSYYNDKDLEQPDTYNWYMGDGARPAGLSSAQTEDMLEQSASWLVHSHNECGIGDQAGAFESYGGTSELESDLTISGGGYECTDNSADGHDGESVVDFGNIDDHGDPPLAVTCWWYHSQPFNNDNIYQADIRFNIEDFDWFYTKPSVCQHIYDLRSVAVHEFGHAFGLGHVSETSHGYLTMSTQTEPCTIYQRTLGKGDILSLQNTY